ncbi:helix-turn-helix domain-containing protein [Coprococcus sp. AM25-15LB]|jgi:excisionase family DNA binding protein|nr:helix-turn-helix domain-containing protein [Coprococcus sp. AM25-15LB]RJW08354.1 helix-turn-helix domain-containing protein [Coprococcus sp. AM25-4LB]
MSERWVSMEEICKHLGSSRDTVKKMVISYGMPAYKFDRKWKFKISEVDAWMHEKNCISYSEREVNIDVKNN